MLYSALNSLVLRWSFGHRFYLLRKRQLLERFCTLFLRLLRNQRLHFQGKRSPLEPRQIPPSQLIRDDPQLRGVAVWEVLLLRLERNPAMLYGNVPAVVPVDQNFAPVALIPRDKRVADALGNNVVFKLFVFVCRQGGDEFGKFGVYFDARGVLLSCGGCQLLVG